VFMVFIAVTQSFIPARARGPALEQNQTPAMRALFIASLILLLLGIHEGFYNIYFQKGREVLKNGDQKTAISLLERAQKLFFKRDLVDYLALAYDAASAPGSSKQKEEKLLNEVYRNGTVDAAIPSRLGELALEKNDPQSAEKYFSKSIQLDPQNRLKYYDQFAEVEKKLGKKLDTKTFHKILTLLEEYTFVLRNNEHMTILSDNPVYASKLYWFLGMKKENDEFNVIWQQQYRQFMEQYGSVPKRDVL